MIDVKVHFSQLVEFAKTILKFSDEDIVLYKISENVYRGKIEQKRSSNKVSFDSFVVETHLQFDFETISFTNESLKILKGAKKTKFDECEEELQKQIIFSNQIDDGRKDVIFDVGETIEYNLDQNDRIIDVEMGDCFLYVDSVSLVNISNKTETVEIALQKDKAYIAVVQKDSVKDDEVKQEKNPEKKVKPTTPRVFIKTIGQCTIIT